MFERPILALPWWDQDPFDWAVEILRSDLAEAELIVIDNVAEYLFGLVDMDDWDDPKDYPTLAPPFPSFFVEYRSPRYVFGQTDERPLAKVLSRTYGFWFRGFERDDEQPGWEIRVQAFEERVKGETYFTGCEWRIIVDALGAVESYGISLNRPDNAPADLATRLSGIYDIALQPALLAVTFMHCKNVVLRDEVPQPKLSRAQERRRGRPLARYRVLQIEPLKQILAREGQVEQVGLKKALHICRGHFKDYRQSGLFGRQKGIYWWDAHLRGAPEQGIVVKDYTVHPPTRGI